MINLLKNRDCTALDPAAEFYITIYGNIAQSESENISANIYWGKEQAARDGKVAFSYGRCLGYRKGTDGQPEIVPEEAETVKIIYDRYLKDNSRLFNISKNPYSYEKKKYGQVILYALFCLTKNT